MVTLSYDLYDFIIQISYDFWFTLKLYVIQIIISGRSRRAVIGKGGRGDDADAKKWNFGVKAGLDFLKMGEGTGSP